LLPPSRLTLPRSGLERSDFVPWPIGEQFSRRQRWSGYWGTPAIAERFRNARLGLRPYGLQGIVPTTVFSLPLVWPAPATSRPARA